MIIIKKDYKIVIIFFLSFFGVGWGGYKWGPKTPRLINFQLFFFVCTFFCREWCNRVITTIIWQIELQRQPHFELPLRQKMAASLDTDDPRLPNQMKGFYCWRQTRETAAISISMAVALNLEYRNPDTLRYLQTRLHFALSPLLSWWGLGQQVEFTHPSSFVT